MSKSITVIDKRHSPFGLPSRLKISRINKGEIKEENEIYLGNFIPHRKEKNEM